MKYLVLAGIFVAGYLGAQLAPPQAAAVPQTATPPNAPPKTEGGGTANPAIDMPGYLKVAQEAAKHRASRRLTEDEFIKMSAEEGTIILDAGSKEMYNLLHVKGAINLSFPDIAIESLAKTLPDKTARILIYCNNNFTDPAKKPEPNAGAGKNDVNRVATAAFPAKPPTASLNISTYISLYSYGYKNVYELGPLIEPAKSKLVFESNVKK